MTTEITLNEGTAEITITLELGVTEDQAARALKDFEAGRASLAGLIDYLTDGF